MLIGTLLFRILFYYHIDDIGPGNPPPSSISVDSKLPMAFRSWLTWDDE